MSEGDQVLRAPNQAAAWCSPHGCHPAKCFNKHHPELETKSMEYSPNENFEKLYKAQLKKIEGLYESLAERNGQLSFVTDRALKAERNQLYGKCDWIYTEIDNTGVHIPCCTVKVNSNMKQIKCGNGPLDHEQILTGNCGEH